MIASPSITFPAAPRISAAISSLWQWGPVGSWPAAQTVWHVVLMMIFQTMCCFIIEHESGAWFHWQCMLFTHLNNTDLVNVFIINQIQVSIHLDCYLLQPVHLSFLNKSGCNQSMFFSWWSGCSQPIFLFSMVWMQPVHLFYLCQSMVCMTPSHFLFLKVKVLYCIVNSFLSACIQ